MKNKLMKKFDIYRVAAFFLSVIMVCAAYPPYVRAAESIFEIPASDKVYTLVGQSTNKKNDAEYLAIDDDRVYVIFTRRADKPFEDGFVSLTGGKQEIALNFPQEHREYDSLSVDGAMLYPKTGSDGKYVWQVGYFDLEKITAEMHVIITAETKAGGFSIRGTEYALAAKYGMTVTKTMATVNGQTVEDGVHVSVGDTIVWDVCVKNIGEIGLAGITVEDELSGAVLEEHDAFDLAAGGSKILKATYTVQPADAGKQLVNVVTAKTDHGLAETGTSKAADAGYAVLFHANGGENAPDPQTKHTDVDVSISGHVPSREGYIFTGWNTEEDGSGVAYAAGDVYSDNMNLMLYAQWKKQFSVKFYSNLPGREDELFRSYYVASAVPEGGYALTQENKVQQFYDIPAMDYDIYNQYIFKGWYLADGTAMDWNAEYTEDTELYAHWVETGTVAQNANDQKQLPEDMEGKYPGYGLVGIQVRGEGQDHKNHYGEVGSGLRFITVLSQSVYEQINAISGNEAGAEYGFVLARTVKIPKDKQIVYKGENVNGQDTTVTHSFVTNLKCSGVTDHYSSVAEDAEDGYRLYTCVVTYKSAAAQGAAALQKAYGQQMTARAYIRYYDANGLLRIYHSNYIGNSKIGHGCSASYDMAMGMIN